MFNSSSGHNKTLMYTQHDASLTDHLMPFIQRDSLAAAQILHTWMRKRERGGEKGGRCTTLLLQPHLCPPPVFTFLLPPFSPSSSPPLPPLLLLLMFSFSSAGTPQFQSLRKLSQEPVQTPIPSSGTPVQLTLLSWPDSTPGGQGGGGRGRKWEKRRDGRGKNDSTGKITQVQNRTEKWRGKERNVTNNWAVWSLVL